jgi:hypothetical protein
MLVFDKNDIKNNITLDDVYNFLQEWGGEPEYTPFGILSTTICHNLPGEGSRKLYYYDNSGLFKCYTGCADSIFDIFELVIKVMSNQHHLIYDLNDAIRWVAQKLGISGRLEDAPSEEELADWKYLANYNRIADITLNKNEVLLKDERIQELNKFIKEEKAELCFLGSVIDLAGLRHELSFLLVIHDDEYNSHNKFIGNEECTNRTFISGVTLKNFEDREDIWNNLHGPSAAMWMLFKKSHVYSKLCNKK